MRRQSAGARVLRAEFAAEPPPPPPEPAAGFPGGIITCNICRAEFRNGAPGYMRHLTTQHAGAVVDASLLALLQSLHRAACTNDNCGGFRRVGMTQCNLCRQRTAARPLREGDVVPGPRSVDPSEARRDQITSAAAARQQTPETGQGDVSLPPGFSERVRLLPGGASQLHQPKALRVRLAKIWAVTLEDINAESGSSSKLHPHSQQGLLIQFISQSTVT